MESKPTDSPYTSVVDLTSKAQRVQREIRAQDEFSMPVPELPDATPENLPERVKQAFDATGWPGLMPVQRKALPYMLEGFDLIVQSRTGSGKTGAFLLPLFGMLDASLRETQALVLAPTRELARQIFETFEIMKSGVPEASALQAAIVYGGVGYSAQLRGLKDGAHVVIGTPGRILDHLERRTFSLNTLRVFILDEADEMLSMGFYPAMQTLKRYLPQKRHSYMFSATMPPRVRTLGKDFLHEPRFLSLSGEQVSVDTIEHRYYRIERTEKDRALIRLIEMENPDSAIIFANTKRDVEYLAAFLKNYGYLVDEISGDLSQQSREQAMKRLHSGATRFLVATDVAARGIDISDLSHVFQYDIPEDPEYYIHRTGRTARAGKEGVAIALTTLGDEHRLLSIARRYGVELDKRELPEPSAVATRVAQRMIILLEERMRRRTNLEHERLQRFIPMVKELAQEEPEVLAMLIDELYQRHIHEQQAPVPTATEDTPASSAQPQPRKGRGKPRSSRGRSQ